MSKRKESEGSDITSIHLTKSYSMFKDGFFNTKKIPKGFNFAYGASIVHVDSCSMLDIGVIVCDKRNEFYDE